MRRLSILVLIAACGEPAVEERLASRRIALGLDEVFPIPFEAAMQALEEKTEPDLKRGALGRLDAAAALDTALRIETAMKNAALGERPVELKEGMRTSARLANAWARSAAVGDPEVMRTDARALLDSCIECHKLYRN